MSIIKSILVAAGMVLPLGLLHAQTSTIATADDAFTALSMTGPDVMSLRSLSDVQLAAFVEVLNGIPTTPMASLPGNGRSSTFFSLKNPSWPPLPFDSSGSNVWQLADGSFLVDDLNYDYQAKTQSSTTTMTLDATSPPSPGGGGSGGTNTNYPNVSGYTVSQRPPAKPEA